MQLLPYVTGAPGGVSGGLMEVGVLGGLVLGALAKSGLRCGWRRITAPKGRHRH